MLMKKELVIFFSILLSVLVIGFYIEFVDSIKYQRKSASIQISTVSPPVFECAHTYHGVLTSYWSKDKNCYVFKRKGIECELFTKAFWSWYIKKYQEERNKDVR